jgi:hypothetical protein
VGKDVDVQSIISQVMHEGKRCGFARKCLLCHVVPASRRHVVVPLIAVAAVGTLSERSLGIIKFAFDTIDTDGSGKLSQVCSQPAAAMHHAPRHHPFQEEFEFAFKKVMVLLCREQRIEMFVKVDLDCRCASNMRGSISCAHTICSGTIEFEEFLSFFVEPVDMCASMSARSRQVSLARSFKALYPFDSQLSRHVPSRADLTAAGGAAT